MKSTKARLIQLDKLYQRIKEEYGKSGFYGWFPNLVIYHDESEKWRGRQLLGEFCSDTRTITLNLAAHRTTKSLLKTLLHEYRHYLQNPAWYARYAAKHSYDKHPYELDAWDFAAENIETVMGWLTKKN